MNLLARETIDLNEGTGGWEPETNCTLARHPSFSPFTENLTSGGTLNSLKVDTTVGGDVVVSTEVIQVTAGETYKASAWTTAETARTVEATLRFYDASNVLIAGSTPQSFTTHTDRWLLIAAIEEAPPNAVSMDFAIEWTAPVAGELNWVAFPAVFNYLDVERIFTNYALGNIPDYLIEADSKDYGYPTWPLLRYLAVALGTANDATVDIINFDYRRSADSIEGDESLSTLTDPLTADPEWFGWLAQQVGVTLSTVGAGATTWQAFVDGNILDWDDWEQDIVPGGGTVPDSTWVGIEGYDSEAVLATLDAFRNQIATGFNGVLSSSVGSLSSYIKTLLNTTDDDPFVYIRKHYKTNPWYMAIVVLATDDPDPGGDSLANEVRSGTPAGILFFNLNGVTSSADIAYEAGDFFGDLGNNIEDGYDTLPLIASGEMRFIPDLLDTGRGAVLHFQAGNAPYNGGGIARTRHFSEGHALYSGFVQANIPSSTLFDSDHWDLDIQVLISDVVPTAGRVILAEMANTWTLSILSDGKVKLDWTADLGQRSYTSANPVNFERDTPFWLKIGRFSEPNGATDSWATYYVYTRNTDADEWVAVDAPSFVSVSGIPVTNATNGITLFQKDSTVAESSTGVIHRFAYFTGQNLIGFSLDYPHTTYILWNDQVVSSTFTLSLEGDTTASIDFDATAAEVKSAIEATSGIGVGDNITVSGLGTYDDPWVITFPDPLEISPDMTVADSGGLTSKLTKSGLQHDLNFLDTTNSNIYPGSASFNSDGLAVTVTGAAASDTTYTPAKWVALKHDGTNDYFHFGVSPLADGGTANTGDTLEVDMGSSNTYYWTITYYDDTTDTGVPTIQTIVWDADDYGGSAIKNITVRTGSHAGTIVAQFLPAIVNGADSGDDAYTKTWTLTRSTVTSQAYYWEPSSFVDRSCIMAVEGRGYIQSSGYGAQRTSGYAFHQPLSVTMGFRNLRETPTSLLIASDSVTDGPNGPYYWRLEQSSGWLRLEVFDGIRAYQLQYQVTLGEWMLLAFRMSPTQDKIQLLVNGVVEAEAEGYFPNQYLKVDDSATTYASVPDDVALDALGGSVSLQARVALEDWSATSGTFTIMSKRDGSGSVYDLGITAGKIFLNWDESGTPRSEESTATLDTRFASGQTGEILVYLDYDNGSSQYAVTFQTSDDGFSNATLGSTITGSTGITSITNSTGELWIGQDAIPAGTKIYEAKINSFFANFADTGRWSPASATGLSSDDNHTITLEGDARIVRDPLYAPVLTQAAHKMFLNDISANSAGFQFTHFAYYDRWITDEEIAALMVEEGIS